MEIYDATPINFEKPTGDLGIDWHVIDDGHKDGICINENVVVTTTTFSLRVKPVGKIRILQTR